jgi:hypothetical protein
MADDVKLSDLEQVREAWNFPLFDAIFNRRSRRFGLGMEIPEGPNRHKSEHDPMPLDEVEEALLIAAGTGVSGMNLSDMPHTPRPETLDGVATWDGMCNTMVEHVGRTWGSPCGNHGTELFYTNDEGVYMLKLRDVQPSKLQELASDNDRDRLINFVREHRIKLFDGRLDIPRNTGAIMSFNLWNANQPGSTLFMPVSDVTEEMINALMLQADLGQYLIDDLHGMKPCINEKWIREGWVDTPVPLSMFEPNLALAIAGAEGAFIGHNIMLAQQALGLGGWLFGGMTSFVVLGGTPTARGLGFRFESNPKNPNGFPVPIGIDGGFESFRPPYYKDMDAAVDAVVAKKFGPNGTFNPFAKKPVPYKNRADFLRQVPRTPEKTIQICKETCRYVWDTFGSFPAFLPPMVLYVYIQAQHLELEFYDKYYDGPAYLKTHKEHMQKWHKGAAAAKRKAA